MFVIAIHMIKGNQKYLYCQEFMEEGREMNIGRDSNMDILIVDPTLSRSHARLKLENEELSIQDMGSSNGTFINDQQIDKKMILKNGDMLRLGSISLEIKTKNVDPSISPNELIMSVDDETLDVDMSIDDYPRQNSEEQKLSIIYEVESMFSSPGDEKKVLSKSLNLICGVIEADRGILVLQDAPDQEPYMRLDTGEESDGEVISTTLITRLWKEAAPLLIRSIQADPELAKAKSAKTNLMKSAVIAPILMGNDICGAIYMDRHTNGRSFSQGDLRFLSLLAKLCATALSNSTMIEKLREENSLLREEYVPSGIVAISPQMKKVLKKVGKVAPYDSTVLILGETGTGKEVVARRIHEESNRKDGPFIKVNCAAIPENLLESELFGHAKGAFTGATQSKAGKFQLAHKGTIFLDEIGEMPLPSQSKLLRAIQEKEIDRVGGTESIRVDVRILAATNKDIDLEVKEGRFREDLYYRLNVAVIKIAPIRERVKDIAPLANHLLKRILQKVPKSIPGLASHTIELFEKYDWPGNVREMENNLERAVLFCEPGKNIEPKHFSDEISNMTSKKLKEFISQKESEFIQKILITNHWRKAGAAKQLGITRQTLDRKLNDYNLPINEKAYIEMLFKQQEGNRANVARKMGISTSQLAERIKMLDILFND